MVKHRARPYWTREYAAWDQNRLLPRGLDPDAPLAERIACHWVVVTGYLLDYARRDGRVRTVTLQPLEDAIGDWATFLGVRVIDPEGLDVFLRGRPNASAGDDLPDGWDPERLDAICGPLWERVLRNSA